MASLALADNALGAFLPLPSNGAQVNNDPPTIDPNQNVGLSDLAAGSLTAGSPFVPWATFEQAQSGGSQQIVVRAFKAGAWHTEGFPESLNENAGTVADAPSIDFTGASRTVPWVTWDEPGTSPTSGHQIFASRFASQPAPAQNGGQWIHEGQGTVPNAVPSLNINTNRDATKPSLVGGTTKAGANPAPWIAWQEFDGTVSGSPTSGSPQIFVSHAVPAGTGGACPAGTKPSRGASVGKFCFQQVGIDRVQGPSGQNPSLDIDPTRSGIEADIAFTGNNDAVPWVVWYENSDSNGGHPSGLGLFNADMTFAARAVPDASGDGGFHWQAVGLGTAGKTPANDVLDTSHGGHGECASSQASEQACSLDAGPASGLTQGNGAENPQVAAGTMVPGKATTPWITWDESNANGGPHSVFVARLDAKGDHFDLLNNGLPISHSGLDSTRADITFSRNTPYVSWHETDGSGKTTTFVGHFEGNPASPVFHIDAAGVATTSQSSSDVRSPVMSTCAASPQSADGSACPGFATGTPFFAFTSTAAGPQKLFARSYWPANLHTVRASAVKKKSAFFNGSVNPGGAPVTVHFDFGATSAYGHSTPNTLIGTSENQTSFGALVGGLKKNAVVHYRAVALTDFGVLLGADQVNRCKVPKIRRGISLKKAIQKIRTAGCTAKVKKVTSPLKKGRVVSERPRAGKLLPAGGTVKLKVSKGP